MIKIKIHVWKYIILQFLDTIATNASSDSELVSHILKYRGYDWPISHFEILFVYLWRDNVALETTYTRTRSPHAGCPYE